MQRQGGFAVGSRERPYGLLTSASFRVDASGISPSTFSKDGGLPSNPENPDSTPHLRMRADTKQKKDLTRLSADTKQWTLVVILNLFHG